MRTIGNHAIALLLAWSLSLPVPAALDSAPAEPGLPRPSVDLQPGDVVRIVIDALAHNDEPYTDAGIETTFYFASPANRVNTGPLPRFTRMVKSPPYGIMVDHVKSEFSEVVFTGNKAYQMVNLTAADGRSTVFAFRLGKQLGGEFEGMWMTDAVWPVAVDAGSGQVF
jgi:hypothetical protein